MYLTGCIVSPACDVQMLNHCMQTDAKTLILFGWNNPHPHPHSQHRSPQLNQRSAYLCVHPGSGRLINKSKQRRLKPQKSLRRLLSGSEPGSVPLCSPMLSQFALIILTSKIPSRYLFTIPVALEVTAALSICACRWGCASTTPLVFVLGHEVMWASTWILLFTAEQHLRCPNRLIYEAERIHFAWFCHLLWGEKT